ncbi:hypothetical protein BRADI_1g37911v3 [Brachypodium distachyon]|uniref:Uncharacterized protein n=1 Tax=Brachypodium distachyon TaxID=15368 RepID=A0A2K2DNC6_BRADI|nr:hypothetical protein BRADI_1g37911v3 [Brachypodium distachyon]
MLPRAPASPPLALSTRPHHWPPWPCRSPHRQPPFLAPPSSPPQICGGRMRAWRRRQASICFVCFDLIASLRTTLFSAYGTLISMHVECSNVDLDAHATVHWNVSIPS